MKLCLLFLYFFIIPWYRYPCLLLFTVYILFYSNYHVNVLTYDLAPQLAINSDTSNSFEDGFFKFPSLPSIWFFFSCMCTAIFFFFLTDFFLFLFLCCGGSTLRLCTIPGKFNRVVDLLFLRTARSYATAI